MDDDDVLSMFLACIMSKPKPSKRLWVHPILRPRKNRGEYFTLCRELRSFEDKFFGYFRMNQDCFDELVDKLKPCFPVTTRGRRDRLSLGEKLALTLR